MPSTMVQELLEPKTASKQADLAKRVLEFLTSLQPPLDPDEAELKQQMTDYLTRYESMSQFERDNTIIAPFDSRSG